MSRLRLYEIWARFGTYFAQNDEISRVADYNAPSIIGRGTVDGMIETDLEVGLLISSIHNDPAVHSQLPRVAIGNFTGLEGASVRELGLVWCTDVDNPSRDG